MGRRRRENVGRDEHTAQRGWGLRVENDADWIARKDAEAKLGLSRWTMRRLTRHHHLKRARSVNGEPGYIRRSVEAEAAWRADSHFGRRVTRCLGCWWEAVTTGF